MHRPTPSPPGALVATASAVLCAMGFHRPALAETVELPAVRDTTLVETADGSLSNGAGQYFFAGNTAQGDPVNTRRGLVGFDVAGAIPPGSTITSVALRLHVSKAASSLPRLVGLHRVLQPWGEGDSAAIGGEGVGAPAAEDDATWLYTFFVPADPATSLAWATPGGDFVPVASTSVLVGGQNSYATWPSRPELVADVQGWLDDPASDHGWLLLGDESVPQTAKRFDTRQFAGPAARRPVLTVVFTPPSGGDEGACCLPDGSCVLAADAPDCEARGGSFAGPGTDCGSIACPPATGACCLPTGGCVVLDEAACANAGGTYLGDAGDCADASCPLVLEPFVAELPIPPVAQPVRGVPGGAAEYAIAARETLHVLHPDLPPTVVWGYDDGTSGPSWPGPTILATAGAPVTVHWSNDLRYATGERQGDLRNEHVLPVDECLHGPHHAGSTARTVVHLHGAHVEARYDGYPELTKLPGDSATYRYGNDQPGATLWYHDHALGITRLNVMMGLAGAYVLRDGIELALAGDGRLPTGAFDVPLIIQDRELAADGSLVYPAAWQDHFFGRFAVVNGAVWPRMTVRRGIYRLRLVGGANSRTFTLARDDGGPFTLIGTDGGLLETPVVVSELTLAPGERIEVLVDFRGLSDGTEITLLNTNVPAMPSAPPLPEVMKFVVDGDGGFQGEVPAVLRKNERLDEADAAIGRDFLLRREPASSPDCADPWWLINGLGWDDITERPELGSTEIWRFVNPTGIMHPMHLHLVSFQVLDHVPVSIDPDGTVTPLGPPEPPGPTEGGWKDTVRVRPGMATRVIARFEDFTGKFAYHCHVLEHEDHEMMRQFQTMPPCFPDADRDGIVGFVDVLAVLASWGGCPSPCSPLGEIQSPDTCPGDVDRNCRVDVADLQAVLGAWGPC